MIITRLYTDYAFDSREKAEELFQFLEKYPLIISPEKYGVYEPLKHVYKSGKNKEAVEMLTGYDVARSGDILLKGKRNKFLCGIKWCEGGRIMEWTFWLGDIILKKDDLQRHFFQFITDISLKYNIISGGIAVEEEWKNKHWKITKYSDGGESHSKIGLDWEGYLTGLYWTTILGERLYNFFSINNNNKYIDPYIIDNTNKVKLLMLDKTPFNFKSNERLQKEKLLMKQLGEKYFFDINKMNKKLIRVNL